MTGFVYILTNHTRSTLYIGVTDNLRLRLQQHQKGEGSAFTKKYNLHTLVYFEEFSSIVAAIDREKHLKRWRREKKDWLIKLNNPNMTDISRELMAL